MRFPFKIKKEKLYENVSPRTPQVAGFISPGSNFVKTKLKLKKLILSTFCYLIDNLLIKRKKKKVIGNHYKTHKQNIENIILQTLKHKNIKNLQVQITR